MKKNFGTNKNYIKTIVQCTIKVKVGIGYESKEIKNPYYGSEMLTCGRKKRVVNEICIKKTVLLGIAFFLMQLYQPARNVDYNGHAYDFLRHFQFLKSALFCNSCFDCHSNSTNYPWYSYVQPVRMFLDSHINEGKENLNLVNLVMYSKRNNEVKQIE
jgi:hypothetical protein